jgi:hypothetical protein
MGKKLEFRNPHSQIRNRFTPLFQYSNLTRTEAIFELHAYLWNQHIPGCASFFFSWLTSWKGDDSCRPLTGALYLYR